MSILQQLRIRLSLQAGTDAPTTIRRLSAGAALNAENLWMLGCSAVLASIGLDTGSAAVVIGAMLISPLMGPILGAGLGVGIRKRDLLLGSLGELGIATLLVLLVSGTYFLISPLATPTTEIVARTRPTLLDVGIAFFGGVAGIVAGSRKEPSMAIPGVAIATALMPPLCTAGFGLATGNWAYFLGAFYLYVLNAVFIAVSTFLAVRLLHFPQHEKATVEERARERHLVALVVILAALPSVWFLYETVRGLREQARITTFLDREVERPGRAVPQWEHVHNRGDEILRVYVVGRPVEDEEADSLNARTARYGLGGLRLELVQSDISAEDLHRFEGEVQRRILQTVAMAVATRDSSATAGRRNDSLRLVAAAREVAGAFPEITGLAYARPGNLLSPDSIISPPSIYLTFAASTASRARRDILARAQAMLRLRLGADSLVVIMP